MEGPIRSRAALPYDRRLRVNPEDLRTKRQLAKWVERGTTYARSLPAKR
jgi:hypothetical protein